MNGSTPLSSIHGISWDPPIPVLRFCGFILLLNSAFHDLRILVFGIFTFRFFLLLPVFLIFIVLSSTYFTFPSSTSRPSAGSSFFLPILLPHPSLLFIFLIIILILLLLLQLLLLLFFLAINLVFILFIRLLLLLLPIFTLLSFHFFLCLVIFFLFILGLLIFLLLLIVSFNNIIVVKIPISGGSLAASWGARKKKIHKHYPYGSTPTLSDR